MGTQDLLSKANSSPIAQSLWNFIPWMSPSFIYIFRFLSNGSFLFVYRHFQIFWSRANPQSISLNTSLSLANVLLPLCVSCQICRGIYICSSTLPWKVTACQSVGTHISAAPQELMVPLHRQANTVYCQVLLRLRLQAPCVLLTDSIFSLQLTIKFLKWLLSWA